VGYKAETWGYYLALTAKKGTSTIPIDITCKKNGTTVANDRLGDALALNLRQYSLGTTMTGDFYDKDETGIDGDAPAKADYVGDEQAKTGFYALDRVDLFNLMILPADEDVTAMSDIWAPASIYCQKKRAFLLVDPPACWNSTTQPEVVYDISLITNLRNGMTLENAAVFFPNLKYKPNSVTRPLVPPAPSPG